MSKSKKQRKPTVKKTNVDREREAKRRRYKRYLYFMAGVCMETAESNGHPLLTTKDVEYILDNYNKYAMVIYVFYLDENKEEKYHAERINHKKPMRRADIAINGMDLTNEVLDEWFRDNTENDYTMISTGYVAIPDQEVDTTPIIEPMAGKFRILGAWDPLICGMVTEKRERLRREAGLEHADMLSDVLKNRHKRTKVGIAVTPGLH